jgi:hypothetical protein
MQISISEVTLFTQVWDIEVVLRLSLWVPIYTTYVSVKNMAHVLNLLITISRCDPMTADGRAQHRRRKLFPMCQKSWSPAVAIERDLLPFTIYIFNTMKKMLPSTQDRMAIRRIQA